LSLDALFISSKGKLLGFMAHSWDSLQTSSIKVDNREAQGLSPNNREPSYNSFEEDYEVFMHKASCGWRKPAHLAMVTPKHA
jgi:hypothetical protein